MAIDEVLLRTTPKPLLRFYRWREQSVSFGYFDRFEEAHQFAGGRALVRRWTGGGIVPHGEDVTYSVMISPGESAFHLSSPEIYRRIHEAIGAVLRKSGVNTEVVATAAPRISAACFANPVAADLVEDNRKIAGAAHRKTRGGLLHQGSIQRNDLDESFREQLASALSSNVEPADMSTGVLEAAEKLAADRYATETWLRRR
ncbi:MAG: hypothetical protein DLM52_13175 [Chthoniobacterales bacterium]|nr:MAG: hypothetical protein DLM52_13175 [Chthoniobacterales bacterium]